MCTWYYPSPFWWHFTDRNIHVSLKFDKCNVLKQNVFILYFELESNLIFGGRGGGERGSVYFLFSRRIWRGFIYIFLFKIFVFSITVPLNKLQWNFVNIVSLKNSYHLISHHVDKFRLVLGKSVLHDTCIWYAKFYWNVHS